MTRIVAGSVGGRRIATPRGPGTRPTAERVREAVFSSLEAQLGTLAGLCFLDLYAGSGAVGLEALSRGASRATLVERDRRTAALARDNAAALGLAAAHVVTADVTGYLAGGPGGGETFDVAFLDPPYHLEPAALDRALRHLLDPRWLTDAAVVVVERAAGSGPPSWPDGLEPLRARRYGDTAVWYGRAT